ncbi:hypothetical protein [Streptosporangium sp. CA-115845]|uniref:hypothetical protein n=1 Tax=Streptosporangium sp. CA-115845 TaxID=3240071 RepID=UPI003D912B60
MPVSGARGPPRDPETEHGWTWLPDASPAVQAHRQFDYSDAELVGKGAHYAYFEGSNTTMLRLPGLEHRYAFLVQGGTFLGRADMFRHYGFEDVTRGEDTRLVRRLKEDRVKIYSADRFNFVYWRSGDAGMHTWQADDIKLTRNAQFSFVGHPDAHVMI